VTATFAPATATDTLIDGKLLQEPSWWSLSPNKMQYVRGYLRLVGLGFSKQVGFFTLNDPITKFPIAWM
jgi:hypothetical protein